MSAGELDARSLLLLRAIGDRGSITGAAEQLGYSQPAVSQQVRRLERRFGLPLVERSGRRVRLTEAGRALARHATAVTAALAAAEQEAAELRGLRSGTVRLVGFPSASPSLVPRLVVAMGQRHPGLRLAYVEAEPPEAIAAISEDRADLALTFSYPGDRDDPHRAGSAGLSVQDVVHDEMLVVLPAGHPATAPAVELAELADTDWIAGCPQCRGHLMQLCRAAGFNPRITFETDNYVAVTGLVALGAGVAMLPRMALDSAGPRPGIDVRPTLGRDRRTLHLVTRGRGRLMPAVAAVSVLVGELLSPR